jgi:hypothetical protein
LYTLTGVLPVASPSTHLSPRTAFARMSAAISAATAALAAAGRWKTATGIRSRGLAPSGPLCTPSMRRSRAIVDMHGR